MPPIASKSVFAVALFGSNIKVKKKNQRSPPDVKLKNVTVLTVVNADHIVHRELIAGA